MKDMSGFIESNEDEVTQLLQQLGELKGILMADWTADREMDEVMK